MTPNELRIGNLVLYKGELFEIDFDSFNIIKELEPIELTEEILLKCGLEELEHLYKLHLLNSLNLIYNSEHNGWYLDIYHNTSKIELRYVHELQNLYFSLTGKELEIKLQL